MCMSAKFYWGLGLADLALDVGLEGLVVGVAAAAAAVRAIQNKFDLLCTRRRHALKIVEVLPYSSGGWGSGDVVRGVGSTDT